MLFTISLMDYNIWPSQNAGSKSNIMSVDEDHEDEFYQNKAPPNGERCNWEGTAMEILTRVELELAYSSEKLLNLEILLLEVAGRASDIESINFEDDCVLNDSVEKAFEFDILSGFLDSEVKELDNFMTSLQMEIVDARQKVSHAESSRKMEVKLHDAEISLKQFRDLVADIRKESVKFESAQYFVRNKCWAGEDGITENGDRAPKNTKWTMQTTDQQRHVLQMLEKSLARELDLEKKLSESRSIEEELKLKLHQAEQESYCLEDSIETIMERLFEADNAAELLLGVSKEFAGKLNAVQFSLNASLRRESEVRSKLQEEMNCADCDDSILLQENDLKASLKEAEDKWMAANSEVLTLREKVLVLEEQLKESDVQLQLAKASVEASQEKQNNLHSKLSVLESIIEGLKQNASKTESRAEGAEAKSTELTKANMELAEELNVFKSRGSEKASFLERKLKESDTQLEHAKASVEAIVEQQNLLKSTMADMEHMIEDLKGKVSKAETRAESAESKCSLLTETNLELNEELCFLRSRIEILENSLRQAEHAKVSSAKDIGIRTKVIADLVTKLALERERLYLQISALTKKNKILAEKCKQNEYAGSTVGEKENEIQAGLGSAEAPEEASTESSSTDVQVKSAGAVPVPKSEIETTLSAEDSASEESKLEAVTNIEPMQTSWKYISLVLLVLAVSVFSYYVFREENCVA
ncbi:WPP domain-interacting tail-anchored protein 1 isoform X2 [Ananas comosus]|uniref:WPP domain-interacting tail-anchored protein 1 isoform X2 n=1 Tax=Ananas comosus TaxID=4615 RepID=A0A6P5G3J1_ANACO|nr:WPP domain-interacting tail-anchored protein 1 isoform X2 [Ananas comosus]